MKKKSYEKNEDERTQLTKRKKCEKDGINKKINA